MGMATRAALGVLRQNEEHRPKLWQELKVDPERRYVSTVEHRGRYSGYTGQFKFQRDEEPDTVVRPRPRTSSVDRNSIFYQKARAGFPYWHGTNDIYTPKNPVKTNFSFGERFNPGRLGVKCDRSYTAGGTNYHYWASFESKMTPIGSGKVLSETKRYY